MERRGGEWGGGAEGVTDRAIRTIIKTHAVTAGNGGGRWRKRIVGGNPSARTQEKSSALEPKELRPRRSIFLVPSRHVDGSSVVITSP